MQYRPITSLEDLQREQFIINERLKARKESLKGKLHQIPGELAAAGVNSFIPKILRGKVTNAALNGGKKLVNSYFAPDGNTTKSLIGAGAKGRGILSGIKSIFKLVRGK